MILKTTSLPKEVLQVILDKGTEQPYTGAYDQFDEPGSYLCRLCGLALYRSTQKFHSGCGWPSFDEEIGSNVQQQLDSDGHRTEIVCWRCQAHLGHVFVGESLTDKNLRYCVNSVSLDFVPDLYVVDTEEVIVAGGCFWGIQHLFDQLPGVAKTEVGYIGGNHPYPTYQFVCRGDTGYVEGVRVVYDPKKIALEQVLQYFFEIHDPTQQNGQGPDLGAQYLSRIFYYSYEQKQIAELLINQLRQKGLQISTQLLPMQIFWPAEREHQYYYRKTGKHPYCHFYTKRFDVKEKQQ